MHRTILISIVLINLLLTLNVASLFSQDNPPPSRFSHKGVKGAIGMGSFENEFGKELTDGEAGSLSLGYGFDDKFTLWLTVLGVEHPENTVNTTNTEFGAIELSLQYKFMAQSRIQPYGKFAVGFYGIGEKDADVSYYGGGFSIAAGAEWFFSRHFGIGAELMYKNIDYSKENRRINGKDVVSDIRPNLAGQSKGFLISLIIQ